VSCAGCGSRSTPLAVSGRNTSKAAVASCGDVANERASIVADRLDAIIPRLRAA